MHRIGLATFLTTLVCAPLVAQGAAFVTVGTGCPTPTSPSLSLAGWPILGSTSTLLVDDLPGDAVLPFALIAHLPANVPLDPLGATGCTLLVDDVVTSPFMAAAGSQATVAIALPAQPALVGLSLEMQAAALSPSSNAFGIAASDRGTMTIGGNDTNVVLLVADDQRWDSIAAFGGTLGTPNIDQLVQAGFSFRNTYNMGANNAAVCNPSRAMFLTGRNLGSVWTDQSILGVASIPSTLKAAGYDTFGTGKWHQSPAGFAAAFDSGDDILFSGCIGCSNTSNYLNTAAKNRSYTASLSRLRNGSLQSGITENGVHVSERFGNAAADFISLQTPASAYFAYASFTAPHDPRAAPLAYSNLHRNQAGVSTVALPANFMTTTPINRSAFDGNIRDEVILNNIGGHTPANVKEELADYYGMITHMDEQIGNVIDAALLAEGLDPSTNSFGDLTNTVFVFTSDHGLAIGSHGLMGKQNPFEHSIRCAPLTWAGAIAGIRIPHGQSDALVYLSDIFPTLMDMLGRPTPLSVEAESLAGIITGTEAAVRDSVYNAYRNLSRAVRVGDWKMMYYPGLHKVQLFDLATDPDELNDLSASTVLWPLMESLATEMRQLESQLNAAGTTSIPASMFAGLQITWEPPHAVTNVNDILPYSPVLARNGGASAVTVSGIAFAPSSLGSGAFVGALIGQTTGNSSYDALMNSFTYGGGTSTSVEVDGLTPGASYVIQAWYADLRGSSDGRIMTFSDSGRVAVAGESSSPAANSVQVTGNPAGINPPTFRGQFCRGTFTATATSGTLRLATNGFGNAHYNALLVQRVP